MAISISTIVMTQAQVNSILAQREERLNAKECCSRARVEFNRLSNMNFRGNAANRGKEWADMLTIVRDNWQTARMSRQEVFEMINTLTGQMIGGLSERSQLTRDWVTRKELITYEIA